MAMACRLEYALFCCRVELANLLAFLQHAAGRAVRLQRKFSWDMVYQIHVADCPFRKSRMSRKLTLQPVGANFSLKEYIYEVLKDAIMGMNIYEDDVDLRLDERKLAEQLGISRTPIREALARLQQEGFVEIVPRRGAYIKRKSLEEVLEMILVWAALESMAARLATQVASDKDIGSLRKLVASFNHDAANANIDEYSESNIQFHQRIFELSEGKMLKTIADGLFVHMRAIRHRAMAEGDRVSHSIVDHMHIIEAIEDRNSELADQLVREHTMRLYAHVKKTWTELAGSAAERAG